MAKLVDPHEKHDWSSEDYVSFWATRQDGREQERREAFETLAETIPYSKNTPIRILDVGAGYGGLTQFLLQCFPNATAVCHDGSEEMAELGEKRMGRFKGRFSYVISDFSKKGWTSALKEPFEAVVSSIAIHNVREPEVIRSIYAEIYPLVKPGGCFLNFDRTVPSLEELLSWLTAAGFKDVKTFYRQENKKRAVFGGFKR
ncbi:MAG TPA: class I SAM-dependent methyltransferase [Candidatus Acidoferrales bacterium]|nr:class I SAM-dependent methyltransferase [Candidatus Acidoferrales bacterium]